MEKNQHKFIFFIIFLIISIVLAWFFGSFFLNSVDRNTYLEPITGEVFVNDNKINIWEKEKLNKNDIVETKTNDSLAVIEWWDWSLTRLWWNTKIEILENEVSKNKNNINILFKLSSWKTWSNVISYLWDDSYFKQVFNDSEASVRGTIFMVDLEKDYLQVDSHEVVLQDPKIWELNITKNKQIKLSDFKFISFEDFIKFFKDKWFFELNQQLDKEYFLKLSLDLKNKIDEMISFSSKNISNLTSEQREKIYSEFMEKYQDLNFVSPAVSEELFNLKMNLKEKLLELSPENSKKMLLWTYSYDLADIFDSKNFANFDQIVNTLKENEKYLDKKKIQDFFNAFNIKFDFKATISESLNNFSENVINRAEYKNFMNSFQNEFSKAVDNQKWVFMEFWDFFKNLFK